MNSIFQGCVHPISLHIQERLLVLASVALGLSFFHVSTMYLCMSSILKPIINFLCRCVEFCGPYVSSAISLFKNKRPKNEIPNWSWKLRVSPEISTVSIFCKAMAPKDIKSRDYFFGCFQKSFCFDLKKVSYSVRDEIAPKSLFVRPWLLDVSQYFICDSKYEKKYTKEVCVSSLFIVALHFWLWCA